LLKQQFSEKDLNFKSTKSSYLAESKKDMNYKYMLFFWFLISKYFLCSLFSFFYSIWEMQ